VPRGNGSARVPLGNLINQTPADPVRDDPQRLSEQHVLKEEPRSEPSVEIPAIWVIGPMLSSRSSFERRKAQPSIRLPMTPAIQPTDSECFGPFALP
jgi:hypothetical protein